MVALRFGESDARSVYGAFDIAVQASDSEGLPNTVLEAAAAGLPIVATAVGGTGEIVTSGVDGILVAKGDRRIPRGRRTTGAGSRVARAPWLDGALARAGVFGRKAGRANRRALPASRSRIVTISASGRGGADRLTPPGRSGAIAALEPPVGRQAREAGRTRMLIERVENRDAPRLGDHAQIDPQPGQARPPS